MQLLASLGLSGSPHLKVASDRSTVRQVHFQHAASESVVMSFRVGLARPRGARASRRAIRLRLSNIEQLVPRHRFQTGSGKGESGQHNGERLRGHSRR